MTKPKDNINEDPKSTSAEKVNNVFTLILKLSPLAPFLGALALLRYLHIIGKPELFMTSISSLDGLIAILLMGLITLLSITVVFIASPALLAHVVKERSTEASWQPSLGKAFAPFIAFPVFIYLTGNDGVNLTLAMGFIYLLSLRFLSYQTAEITKGILNSKSWNQKISWSKQQFLADFQLIQLAVIFWLAVVFCCFPILVLMSITKSLSEVTQISAVIIYVICVVPFALALSKMKNWWFPLTSLGVLIVFLAYSFDAQILSGATRLLGIRHDEAQWYWIADEKIKPILPASMCIKDDHFAFAATPFAYGEKIVLCAKENKVICPNKDKEVLLEECVTLERSDVKLSGRTP